MFDAVVSKIGCALSRFLFVCTLASLLVPVTVQPTLAGQDKFSYPENSCVIGAAGIGYTARVVWMKGDKEVHSEIVRVGDRRCGPKDATVLIHAQGKKIAEDALAVTGIGVLTVGVLAGCIASGGTACLELVGLEGDVVTAAGAAMNETADSIAALISTDEEIVGTEEAESTLSKTYTVAKNVSETQEAISKTYQARALSVTLSGLEYLEQKYGKNTQWFYAKVAPTHHNMICLRGSIFRPSAKEYAYADCKEEKQYPPKYLEPYTHAGNSCVIGNWADYNKQILAVWMKDGKENHREVILQGDRRCGPKDHTVVIKSHIPKTISKDAPVRTALGLVTPLTYGDCLQTAAEKKTLNCPKDINGQVVGAEKLSSLSTAGVENIVNQFGDEHSIFYSKVAPPHHNFLCVGTDLNGNFQALEFADLNSKGECSGEVKRY